MPTSSEPVSVARLARRRTAIELAIFRRNKLAVFFTLLLPLLMVVLFGALSTGTIAGPPHTTALPFRQYFVASMIGATIFSLSFSSLAIGVAIEQNSGLVKRLASTPLPRAAYLAGKLGQSLVTSLLATALIVVVGTLFYGLQLPQRASQWAVLVWVVLLGILCCSLLGLAYTRLIRDAKTAPAFVQPAFLGLLFLSGIFFQLTTGPALIRDIASVFPLKWMAQGLRYVFLPDWFGAQEAGHAWHLERIALVLGLWTVISAAATMKLFVWRLRVTDEPRASFSGDVDAS